MSAVLALRPGLDGGFARFSAVDRRFLPILLLSLLLHAGVGYFMHLPAQPPEPLTLQASIRLLAEVTPPAPLATAPAKSPTPPAEALATSAPRAARLPPKTRQPMLRDEQRSAQHQSPPAGSTIASSTEAPAPLASTSEAASPAKAATPAASNVAATPPPAAPAVPAVDALAAYRRQLIEIFARPREYPRIAAMRGWEGEVRLRLKVARKGNLLGIQLDHSSGFEVLDQHALAMLEGHGDLPPLPEGLGSNEISVIVPISYKLRKTT